MSSTADRHRRERGALIALLGGVAVLHVLMPRFFERLVPSWVPGSPRFWNLASGAAEGVSAALLAVPRTRRIGGAAAAATLLAVYPANVQAAVSGGTPGVPGWAGSATAAWLRLPLQLPPLLVALRAARGVEQG